MNARLMEEDRGDGEGEFCFTVEVIEGMYSSPAETAPPPQRLVT